MVLLFADGMVPDGTDTELRETPQRPGNIQIRDAKVRLVKVSEFRLPLVQWLIHVFVRVGVQCSRVIC